MNRENEIKCNSCGASIVFKNEYQKEQNCTYCGEKIINPFYYDNEKTNTKDSVLDLSVFKTRPTLNFKVFFLLLLFTFVIGGLIYYIVIYFKQVQWDKKHGLRK